MFAITRMIWHCDRVLDWALKLVSGFGEDLCNKRIVQTVTDVVVLSRSKIVIRDEMKRVSYFISRRIA